jgi:multidrug efflux pump subunit AcrA (membrane-fusion protein)
MKKMDIKSLLWLGIGLVLVLLVVNLSGLFKGESVLLEESSPSKLFKIEKVQFVPYQVSGVVEATEDLTIYAGHSGYVRALPVTEGDEVVAGELLLLAIDPVTESRLVAQNYAGEIKNLNSNNAYLESDLNNKISAINYSQSVALNSLNESSRDNRLASANLQLSGAVMGIETTVPMVLRFVQDNKSLFTAESMKIYNEVVNNLYGNIPNYLRAGLVTSGDDGSLLSLLSVASGDEYLSLSKELQLEVVNLVTLYQKSESEFFDKKQLTSDDSRYQTYINNRGLLASLSSDLAGAIDAVSTYSDAGWIGGTSDLTSLNSARQNLDTAGQVLGNVKSINDLTGGLAQAEREVVLAELNLGKVSAPFSGYVTDVMVELGQYVNVGEPIMKLSGSAAKELKIKLPGNSLKLMSGEAFLIDGKTVGYVDRVVPVLTAGSMTAYVSLNNEMVTGQIISGQVMAGLENGVVMVPRPYVSFDVSKLSVMTVSGSKISLEIIYDAGDYLLVKPERAIEETIVPNYGLIFNM